IHVLVAATDLEPGRKLRESDVTTIVMAPDVFRTSKYASQTFIGDIKQLQGRVIREAVNANETFGPDRLYSEGTGPTVAEKLPAGMRAVTVKVTGSGFVDGFASPGTYVDVLFRSVASGDQDFPETTITALTNLKVLAVDTSPYPYSKPGATGSSRNDTLPEDVKVTFAVQPSQATMLKALEDRGEISLALRPTVSGDTVVADAVNEEEMPDRHAQTLSMIIEGAKRPMVAVALTSLPLGRVIRAGDLKMVELADGEAGEVTASTYADVPSLVGRVLRSEVTPGQTLTADLLYPEGVNPGVADRLPPGFRAITVKMDQTALVEGFVSPGTEVDVFFRSESIEGYPETTLRVLDGLEVLAIEDRVSAGADPGDVQGTQGIRVTLAVPMGDVGKIQALNGHGTMTLAVRASHERAIGEIARELETTRQELERTRQQIAALEQIDKLDESISLSQGQSEKLASLIAELPRLERELALLDDERDAATTGVSQTTLAEVLNLPDLPRPETLDIYSGGSRQTHVFSSRRQPASASRTASRTTPDATSGKDTTIIIDSKTTATEASETQEVKVKKVTLVSPDRKVSALQEAPLSDDARVRKSVRWGRGNSVLSSVADFGRELVAELSKANQTASRIEIFRGGIKDQYAN
ncbi:MAG: Flp pilus assembly protein CpaB, partial [Planctomycetales bacterium]